MKSSTLLIAAVALAAGVMASKAQVYSQNIVGYVNNPLPAGFSLQAAPFNDGNGNNLTNLISNPVGNFDGTFIYVWNGTSYTIYQFDSSQPTGVANASDTAAVTSPSLPPGTSWFVNSDYTSVTNTYVGTVQVGGPGTGSVGISTNMLSSSPTFTLTGSIIPVGGGVSSVLQLTNYQGSLDGSFIYTPIIKANGSLGGYNIVQFDSSQTTGFANASDTAAVAEPQIPVGSGFFFNNQSGAPEVWVQSF